MARKTCSIGRLLAELPERDAAKLHSWLYVEESPASAIYTELVDDGHTVSYQQINRHRYLKTCSCDKASA